MLQMNVKNEIVIKNIINFFVVALYIYIVINVNCWISPMKAPEIITQMPFGHFKRNVYKSVCLTGNITFHESKKKYF